MNKYTDFFLENRTKKESLNIYNQRIEDAKIIHEKFSDTFVNRTCPYCLSDEFKNTDKFIDLYDVAKCVKCSSLYVNPIPSPEALSYYYNKCECNLLLDKLFIKRNMKKNNNIINKKLQNVLDIIKKFKHPVKILEIGCGSGSFLNILDETLQQNNIEKYTLYGIDLDENALSKSKNMNINFVVGNAETFKIDEKFDLIMHFELIEHLPNPNNMMKIIHSHLKDNGYSFFTTPNSLGLEIKAIHYNKIRFLAHSIFPPMHLNAFNPRNITHFLLQNNFKILNINTPGIFDVSILKNTLLEQELDNSFLNNFLNLDDDTLGYIQDIIKYLDGSSHMTCLVQK